MTEEITDDKELDSLLDDNNEDKESSSTSSSADENSESSDEESSDEETSDDTEEEKVNKSKTVALKRERQMRKESQKENADLKAQLAQKDSTQGKPNSVRQEFDEMKGKLAVQELINNDPTFKERASTVKDILKEMPDLLKKDNGIKIADDIAKGRLITSSEDNEKKGMQTNQTSSAQPKRKTSEKEVTQKGYNQLDADERKAYENEQLAKIANKK